MDALIQATSARAAELEATLAEERKRFIEKLAAAEAESKARTAAAERAAERSAERAAAMEAALAAASADVSGVAAQKQARADELEAAMARRYEGF
jgi:hypothetical protein